MNHPNTYNVYCGLTKFGMTQVVPVSGTTGVRSKYLNKKGKTSTNITLDEYKHVLSLLLKDGHRKYSAQGLTSWSFQQDGDPSHNEALDAIQAFNQRHFCNISLIGNEKAGGSSPHWPPSSPDLNLIENIWSWADAKVARIGCETFQEFKEAVKQTLASVPQAMIDRLYRSMGKRLRECLAREGDKTKY